MEELTPHQIVAELDKYIVGQEQAKRAVAIALRNRYRRQMLPPEKREDILPKNILMIGPTGVGKTEIARRLAQMVKAPFVKVEATKFTEVGYVGRDVDSIIRDLTNVAVRLVTEEKMEEVRERAVQRAYRRLANLLLHPERSRAYGETRPPFPFAVFEKWGPEERSFPGEGTTAGGRAEDETRLQNLIGELEQGVHDNEWVEIDVEEQPLPFVQVFTPQGMEEMGFDISTHLSQVLGKQATKRRVTVQDAKRILTEEEARKMIDQGAITREAIERTEQTGIVFLDELDKIAGRGSSVGPDVSREGVQRDLLPIIEGSTVITKYGPVRTDHILFICAGAFHISKPSDLIPELQGRLPIRVELSILGEKDLRRILVEPENALTKQYALLLTTEGVNLRFTDDAIDEIARMAHEVNVRTEDIGARRLHTVMEKLLEDVMFDAPDLVSKEVVIDAKFVREKLRDLVQDVDLSKYIL
ncbi:MAG: ATP-dependent protease ATPase subunit HslU [Fimbriimonadales bacterium]|nr:ATP-dependent protease ATPase subunit HslU [Fimbriimonadales bacterium]